MKKSSTGSALIAAFTEMNHNSKIQEDQRKLVQFTQQIKKRRANISSDKKGEASFNDTINQSEKYKTIDFHKLPFPQLQAKLGTNIKSGLSQEEAKLRLQKFGPNKLSEKETTHWSVKLIKQFLAPFNILLEIGAILALVTYLLNTSDPSGLYLTIVLIVITLITVFFNFYQLQKAESLIDSFKNFAPPFSIVVREGKEYKVEASRLVVGDVVKVVKGENIPADLRIVESLGMKVNNSTLTGEPILLTRTVISDEANPLEAKSLAFFSTSCEQGQGTGVVYFTGDHTMIGQIATLAASAHGEQSNLSKQIFRYIIMVLVFALSLGLLFFGLGFAVGYDILTNIIFALSVVLGVVPEGLLMQITIILMIAAERMGKRKVLVKNLHSIETLGSTSCICSDKTGTLTQNIMTAAHIFYDGRSVNADSQQKFGPKHKYEYDTSNIVFRTLHDCAIAGSTALFDYGVPSSKVNVIKNNQNITEEEKQARLAKLELEWANEVKTMPYQNVPTISGDASQYGIIKFFQPIEDIQATRAKFPLSICLNGAPARKPFNSFDKMSHVIVDLKNGRKRMFVKGAPERVWSRCNQVLTSAGPVPKSQAWNQKYEETNLAYGKEGQRILGFAFKDMPFGFQPDIQNMNYKLEELVFLGLISLQDPPRDTVPKAVLKCQAAKIKVIMVTGDQPVTALAIAKQCNIITQKTVNEIAEEQKISFEMAFQQSNSIVIHGDLLLKATNEDMGLPESEQGKKLAKWLQKDEIVFARTSPAQKLIIVKGCQAQQYVVAVTGDGVNDAPAIKKADIGVSMGITGTDVAKDAADMVLLNDDFSSIVMGIEEGRLVFDNIKKVVAYTMCSNIPEAFPFIFFILVKYPLPLTPVLILSIVILTDFLPAITISYEAGELDLMTRRPRRPTQHLVTAKLIATAFGKFGMLETWGCLFAYFVVMQDYGFAFWELFGKATINIIVPQSSDVYNPTDKYYGNSNLRDAIVVSNVCPKTAVLDWTAYTHMSIDLRGAALECVKNQTSTGTTFTITPIFKQWDKCLFQQISPVSQTPVCYTTEALKYANSACFFAVVTMQIYALWTMKTRSQSTIFHGMQNNYTLWGYWQEFAVMVLLAYCLPFNYAFGTRDLQFIHHGVLAIPFGMVIIVYDQIRKYLVRNLPMREQGRNNWWREVTYY